MKRRRVTVESGIEEAKAAAQAIDDMLTMAGEVGSLVTDELPVYEQRLRRYLNKLHASIGYALNQTARMP